MGLRWGRILVGGVVAEALVIAIVFPVRGLLGQQAFLASILVASAAMPFLLAAWAARPLQSHPVLHGALVGAVAALVYLGLAWGQPQPLLYHVAHGLKVLGGMAGGRWVSRRAGAGRRGGARVGDRRRAATPAADGSQDDARPDWYHRDNQFRSRAHMDKRHRPIVALALATLGGRGGAVLDLGCGNGALLERILRGDPAVVPYGVEWVPGRLAHAREVLPGFADNFLLADIAGPHELWDRGPCFALALIGLRRLSDLGPERLDRLRAWLARRAERVLVYGYGSSLREHGGLAGFAARFGIELADAPPGATAALVRRD